MLTEIFLFPEPKRRGARLTQILTEWAAARLRERAEAKSLRDLEGLDDRLLRDIGITRADVAQLRGKRI